MFGRSSNTAYEDRSGSSLTSGTPIYQQESGKSTSLESLVQHANIAAAPAMALAAGASAVGVVYNSVKPYIDTATDAKEVIKAAINPQTYINELIPEELREVYSQIDKFVNQYFPEAPEKSTAALNSSQTFNSPSQVYTVPDSTKFLVLVGVGSIAAIYFLKGKI